MPDALSAEIAEIPRSQQLIENFPLFPLVEKRLWRDLLAAEENADVAKLEKIAEKLKQRHPFQADQDKITLGGIIYDKKSRTITIPAEVHYPSEQDPRYPDELELVLCSEKGRTHETLFISEAQPLHLELLMHLAGFAKEPVMSLFSLSISLPDGESIPIEKLIAPLEKDELPAEMIWEFSGSDFNDFYSPDQTGDFIILWHAHPSVLRLRHAKIGSGQIKLRAKKHPKLSQGIKVNLQLHPRK